MAEAWNIEQDLWQQCEFQRRYPASPKPSKHFTQGRASLFDEYSDDEELPVTEPPVKYVRGRPLTKPVKEKKPGGVPSMFSDEETLRQIREVSGLGYSNEHIVRTLKREQLHSVETPPTSVDRVTPDMRPKVSDSTSPSSDSSTSSYKTGRTTPPFMKWKPVSIDITNNKEFPSLNK